MKKFIVVPLKINDLIIEIDEVARYNSFVVTSQGHAVPEVFVIETKKEAKEILLKKLDALRNFISASLDSTDVEITQS